MSVGREADEWLMAQVARGDHARLEPLVRRYASPLLTFITRMVGDGHRAEELFQDAFLAVWVKRTQYRFPRPFKPWLYGIAANKCRAIFRVRKLPIVARPDCGDEALAPAIGSRPGDALLAAETAVHVAAAVGALPARQRAVVVLRIWSELSYAEIADALDTTESTVRSNMHHGLSAMRLYLEPRL